MNDCTYNRKKLLAGAVIDLLIAAAVLCVFLYLVFRNSGGALSSAGLSSLKYFTTLSNIFEGIAAGIFAAQLIAVLSGRRESPSRRAFLLKYTATAAVSVTFLVVMLFLGPLYSYPAMLRGANFWLHLIVPVVSIAEFIALEDHYRISLPQSFLCVIPVAVYGLFYLLNILINGVGEWPHRNDFYGFVRWGYAVGAAIFAGIMVLGWLSGLVLRLRCGKKGGS